MMYGYYGTHMGAGPWVAMGVSAVANLALWLVVAALIFRGLRSDVLRGPRREGRETPTEVLAHRFARGEIDVEEYAARRRVLEGEEP